MALQIDRLSPSLVLVGLVLASACTGDFDDLVLSTTTTTGVDTDGNGDDADTDADTDPDPSSDSGDSCTNPAAQCVELLACLAVVLPDADTSDYVAGGACWCGTLDDALACRDHCISQLAAVDQQYPNVPECSDGSSTGDGDGDPGGLPNLTLDHFSIDAEMFELGEPVTYYFEYGNTGPVDTLYTFQNRLILSVNQVLGDDDDIVFFQVPWAYNIPANMGYAQYALADVPANLPGGEYFVGMELDYTNVIAESNETDNTRFAISKVTFASAVGIDLAPSQVTASEYAVKAGDTTEVSATIDNLGFSDVGPYTVRFYYSIDTNITTGDVLLCSVEAAGLAANTSTVLVEQCLVPALAGDLYLGVIVDPTNAIPESNETNNRAYDAMQVSISPLQIDLEPSAVGATSFTVATNDAIGLSATVTNNGDDPSPAFAIRFYYSSDATITIADHLICQANGPALQPGASTAINSNCNVPLAPTGSYRLGAIVDPLNAISETDESNNTAVHPNTVSLTAPNVDFAYDWHYDDLPYFATPGQNINYTLEIWNHGTSPSPAYEAKMMWSVDNTITNNDITGCTVQLTAIAAQTKVQYQFLCSVPDFAPGQYYSGVIIDPTNAVPETSENNNVGVSLDPQIFQ